MRRVVRAPFSDAPHTDLEPGPVVLAALERETHASISRSSRVSEAKKVGPNPRIAAGSIVVSYWLRLFRCTVVKKTV